MRKVLLAITIVFFCYTVNAQNIIDLLKTNNGIAKQFLLLPENLQKSFSSANASIIIGLNPKSDLKLYSTEKDEFGYIHYRFYQTFDDIPIENSMLIAHVKNGKLISISASIVIDFDYSLMKRPASQISEKTAIEKALKYVGASKYMWQNLERELLYKQQLNSSEATYYPTAKRIWYNEGVNLNPKKLKLSYKIDVYSEIPKSRAFYFLDVSTGAIIGKKNRIYTSDTTGTANTLYNGIKIIHSDKISSNSYKLRDYSRGNGIITLRDTGFGGTNYTSSTSNWSLGLPNRNALDAHWGVEMTYDFYKSKFQRNSIDNKGLMLINYVNNVDSSYKNNSFWDASSINYGTMNYGVLPDSSNRGITSIDVTGHELTHGVTEYTCNLNYFDESGAINESISDIMGKSVQFWAKPNDTNWLIGNDFGGFGAGVNRDMSNPKAFDDPDTYKAQNWYEGEDISHMVHTNSGVGNFMFYLLVNGGSGINDLNNSYNVQKIGLGKADSIIYRSQTVYLVPTSNYPNWRTVCIQAASDLFGANSNEVQQVKNAFFAVGIEESIETSYLSSICFGSSLGEDLFQSINKTSDGQFVNAGSAGANDGDVYGFHGGRFDAWVVKFKAKGIIDWAKCLGGTSVDQATSVQQTFDKGYIVAGGTQSNDGDVSGNHGYSDEWVIKLDSTGKIQWQKCIGGSLNESANKAIQTNDSGYLVIGTTGSTNGDATGSHGNLEVLLIKLNKKGNIQWRKLLGGSSSEEGYDCIQTTDGGYIIVGNTYSSDGDVSGNHGGGDAWAAKLNKSGNIQWQKCYGGTLWDFGRSIKQTSDGGYIFCGFTESNNGDVIGNHSSGQRDGWIVKINKSGSLQWQKCIGGSSSDDLFSIKIKDDKTYVVCGNSWSSDGDMNKNSGLQDGFISNVNQVGNIISSSEFGGSSLDYFNDLIQLNDSTILSTGYTSSNDNDITNNHGYYDAWNVNTKKVESLFNSRDNFTNNIKSNDFESNKLNSIQDLNIFPNPFTNFIFLDFKTNVFSYYYSITDVANKVYLKGKTSNKSIPTNSLPTGIYFLTITVDDNKIYHKTLIKR
jgi:Zn-dependent metalloprotease